MSLLAVHVWRVSWLVSTCCDIMSEVMDSQNNSKPKFRPNPGLTLMDQVREVLRYDHYAYRTEQTSGPWRRRDLQYFGGKTPPHRLGTKEVERVLAHLATEGQVSASTQRQALNALVFLDRDVLHQPLERDFAPVRRRCQQRLPTVLTRAEVQRLLAAMTGRHALMARRLDGSGLRLLECIRLRIQDVDFGQPLIVVRGAKGGTDRTTLLPGHLRAALQAQSEAVNARHHQDLEAGCGAMDRPEALARDSPKATRETGWPWVFLARACALDLRSGWERRHHVRASGRQKAVQRAAAQAGLDTKMGGQTRRHRVATPRLEHGVNIRVLHERLGHAEVKTPERSPQVMARDSRP
jgi:integron integrase